MEIKIDGIISQRALKRRAPWHLVWEWEDELSHTLGVPLLGGGRGLKGLLRATLGKIAAGLGLSAAPGGGKLQFVMIASADPAAYRHIQAGTIWIIDYFLDPGEATRHFIGATARFGHVLISSRQAWEAVVRAGGDPSRYIHVPLSLPSRHRRTPAQRALVKDIDLVLVGRVSARLEEWASRYMAEHPGLRVALRAPRRGGHYSVSTVQGEHIAMADTREQYMELLRRSRLFLYSTPGLEDGKPTGGYSQVTPRLLEALAAGCAPLMRYSDNADTRWYGLGELGPSLDTYEEFASEATRLLALPQGQTDSHADRWLEGHYTPQAAQIFTKA